MCSAGDKYQIKALKKQYMELLDIMSEVLSLNTDFSIYHSLEALKKTAPTNPNFEITLKRNISNNYCSQPAYELVTQVFKAEGEIVFERLMSDRCQDNVDCIVDYQDILARFEKKPLADMQPTSTPDCNKVFMRAAKYMESLLNSNLRKHK